MHLSSLILEPWRRRRMLLRNSDFNGLHCVISQKTEVSLQKKSHVQVSQFLTGESPLQVCWKCDGVTVWWRHCDSKWWWRALVPIVDGVYLLPEWNVGFWLLDKGNSGCTYIVYSGICGMSRDKVDTCVVIALCLILIKIHAAKNVGSLVCVFVLSHYTLCKNKSENGPRPVSIFAQANEVTYYSLPYLIFLIQILSDSIHVTTNHSYITPNDGNISMNWSHCSSMLIFYRWIEVIVDILSMNWSQCNFMLLFYRWIEVSVDLCCYFIDELKSVSIYVDVLSMNWSHCNFMFIFYLWIEVSIVLCCYFIGELKSM
jgi:hypothetical protein